MNKVFSKINRYRLYLVGNESIGLKFKLLGIFLIVSAFGVLATNAIEDLCILGYDISLLIKILMFLLIIEGIICLLFVDTKNFKNGYIGINLRNGLKSRELKVLSRITDKVEEYRLKTNKRTSEKLKFKPIPVIEDVLKQHNVISPAHYDDFLLLIKSENLLLHKNKVEKIPFISLNDKLIFIYDPVFAFLNQIIEGGIYGLYGKSRQDLLRLIANNFLRNASDFDYRNLTNRYGEWLKTYNSNSCINYTLQ